MALRLELYRASRKHIRYQKVLTIGMVLATSASVFAQGTAEAGHGWLDQLTAPTTLLALATLIYNIGMTRQQIKDLEERNRAVEKFIADTLPNTYLRRDAWIGSSRIANPSEKP